MVACQSCSRNQDATRVTHSATGGRVLTTGHVDVSGVLVFRAESSTERCFEPGSVGYRYPFPGFDRGPGFAEPSRGRFGPPEPNLRAQEHRFCGVWRHREL